MAQYRENFQGKGQGFVLRSAEGDDAPGMLAYMLQVTRETSFLGMGPEEFAASYPLEKERAYLEGLAASQDSLLLVAVVENGEIAGNCRCGFSSKRKRQRHRAVLDISVRRDFWRQGLARRLMEIQETWCRQNGVEKICLEVDTANLPAVSLYLRQGFVVEGTLRQEAKLADGSYRDLYVMGKFLK